jgi:hypothetical protein
MAKPTWSEYAADLAARLAERGYDFPTTLVVGVLGFAAEDERLPDHQRAECKGWLDRLVDEQGNPLNDEGLSAGQWAMQMTALQHRGSLSSIISYPGSEPLEFDPPWVELRIRVLRRVAEAASREEVREKLAPHAESYVDLLLDDLFGTERDTEQQSA